MQVFVGTLLYPIYTHPTPFLEIEGGGGVEWWLKGKGVGGTSLGLCFDLQAKYSCICISIYCGGWRENREQGK